MRTVVCQREGCSGNEFYIETQDGNLEITCKECKNKSLIDVSFYEFIMISGCSSCKNDTFKLFRDVDKEGIYVKCTECGEPPEKIYIDADGIQVSYEAKLLNEVKDLMHQIEQRVYNLQMRVETMERGQQILEESLAYINKYIIEQSK